MSRHCTICVHPDRPAIDAALLTGEAYRSIAKRFATSPEAMWRHKSDHLSSALTHAKEAETISHADDLLAKVAAIESEAKRIAKKAEAVGDLRTAMSGVRELARLVELLAKLRGELNESHTVNVPVLPEWSRIRTVLLTALLPFPDAKRAVVNALQGVQNGHAD